MKSELKSINQNRKLKLNVNAIAFTEKEKLKMLGKSSESMKSHHKRAGKVNSVLRSIDEYDYFDFVDSDDSNVFIDPK